MALNRATTSKPVRLQLVGLTLTPSGFLVCAYPTDGAADEFARRLGDELGDDGWFEAALHRDIWYAPLVQFNGDLADPPEQVQWVADRRQPDLGLVDAATAELVASGYTGRHMTRVDITRSRRGPPAHQQLVTPSGASPAPSGQALPDREPH